MTTPALEQNQSLQWEPTLRREIADTGMTLLVRENHEVAVATADVWVHAGSGDETPEISGISHFLEHMVFKGSNRFAAGQMEREIENLGGVCNAGTSYDFTHYYVTMPAENIGRGIEILSEMVARASIDATELEKERLVILEEYRRKQDNPAAMLYEDLYEQLYESGPYHRPVIGLEQTIRSITREQMVEYYETRYTPTNMALVLTGDVSLSKAEELAGQGFSGFSRVVRPVRVPSEPTRLAHSKRHHRHKPTGGELYLALACPAPAIEKLDQIVPLDVAQFILGQGRASILFQEIKEKRELSSTISCHFSAHHDDSLFVVSATCDPARREALAQGIREQLRLFAAGPISPDQLNRARRLLTSAHLFSFERTGSSSSEIGYYYTLTGGIEFLDHYLERLASVTAEEVRVAFESALNNHEMIEVSVGPESGISTGAAD